MNNCLHPGPDIKFEKDVILSKFINLYIGDESVVTRNVLANTIAGGNLPRSMLFITQ